MDFRTDALAVLKETSRTFYIPISQLPPGLIDAVASAYLLMRAIDEIEDHEALDNATKARLLRSLSLNLQASVETSSPQDFALGLEIEADQLPEVSLRIGEWARLAPITIAPRIWDATAAMADRMAYWAERNWSINTKAELDQYTFSVAGAVGLLLSDLWAWHDGTQTNRMQAIGFGRGLQAVNIARNYKDDLERGVSFFPDGWQAKDIRIYARQNLTLADAYTHSLERGPARTFCQIPLALAHATLDALDLGAEKLTRNAVHAVIESVMGRK
ncbi:MAG: phytoene/squalene synthase family protein [Merismopedia sp. SIO2A8]|nr:phytoene/squalene synthase family protein [Symploca sp. SIO2B6]NET48425.1 phytoene/squalene synthase family protein [Merismopedia sp. SIO2A8]